MDLWVITTHLLIRNRTTDLLAKHSKHVNKPGFKELIGAMLMQTHDPDMDLQPVVDSIPVHDNRYQPIYPYGQSNNPSSESVDNNLPSDRPMNDTASVNTQHTNDSNKGKKKFFDPRRIFAKK